MSPQANTAQQDNWWVNDPVYTGNADTQGNDTAVSASPSSQENTSQGKWWTNDPVYVAPETSAASSTPPSTLADIGKSIIASGIPRGVAAVPMWAANIGNLAAHGEQYLAEQAHNAITGKPLTPQQQATLYQNPFYSSEDVLQGITKATGLPAPYEPQTAAGKFADTATQFAVGAPAFGMSIPAAVAAGFASEGAGQLTKGTPLEPAARLIGAVTGNAGAGAAEGAAKSYAQPFTASGRQDLAAQQYFKAAENPQAAGSTLANPPDLSKTPPDQVGVSQPTTAQVTQDPGLVRLQKQLEAQNPTPFQQRAAEQEQAQNAALNIAPNGDPAEVGRYFTGQLQALEAQGSATRNAAINNVAKATDALGGYQSSQEYGESMRQGLQQAYNASNANEAALWKPLESYYGAPVTGSTVPETVNNILTRLNPRGGQTITPKENQIYNAVKSWQGNPTFGDLRDLRSSTTDAIREIGDIQGYGSVSVMRLMGVKNAIDQSLENGIGNVVAQEKQAVAAGQMPEEQTLETNVVRQAQDWYNRQNAAVNTARRYNGQSYASASRSGQAAFARLFGTAEQTGGQSSGVARNQSLSPEAPQFSQDINQQYQAARAATSAQKSTFGGDIGDVLAPTKILASDVPAKFFNDRASSQEKIQAFIKAAGDRPAAVNALRDYAVSKLRSDVINPDGTIDAAKFDRWTARYKNALESFPELKKQLSNVRDAQATLDDTVAHHDAAIDAFRRSRANMFLEKQYGGRDYDPLTAASRIFSSGNSAQAASELMRLTNGDQNAQAGLQRIVNDYLIRKVRGSLPGDELGVDLKNPRSLRQFLDTHKEALKVFYGNEGYNNLARVANETLHYDTADSLAKNVKGQSEKISTYQWLKERLASHPTLSKVGAGGVVGGATLAAGSHLPQLAGVALAHPVIGAMGIAAGLATAMRQARISSVDALVQKAALHPEFAAELFKTYSAKVPPVPAQRKLAAALIKSIPLVTSTYEERRRTELK